MSFVPNQFLGLIKFFKNESYLDALISGCFHCTPPERYRLNEEKGIGDKYESCFFSYRPDRGDEKIIIKVADHEINPDDIVSATIFNRNDRDSWMHCWSIFRLPPDELALQRFKDDIVRMQSEFGNNYAFIHAHNLKPFVQRLTETSEKKMYCGEVKYSQYKNDWGNLCKSLDFSYQREYRFLFGECETSEMDFYIFHDPNGFDDYIQKNPEIKLENKDKKITWFQLLNK